MSRIWILFLFPNGTYISMSILTQNPYTHSTFLTLKTEPTEGHLRLCYGKIEEPIPVPWVESGVGSMDAGIPIIFLMSWMINIHYTQLDRGVPFGVSYQNTEETLLLRIFSANFHQCNFHHRPGHEKSISMPICPWKMWWAIGLLINSLNTSGYDELASNKKSWSASQQCLSTTCQYHVIRVGWSSKEKLYL